MKTRLLLAVALLLAWLPVASRAASGTAPITGGGSGGSLTGSVWFPGPFTVSGTNWYLNASVSNLAVAPIKEYATNYQSLLRAYTNVIHVGYSNDALSSGLNLTNISTKAPAGSLVVVGPGAYNIPTNNQSLAGRGVDMYFQPGAIVSVGRSSDLTTTSAIFDDALAGTGATTNRIMGFGEFHSSNALGGIVIMQEGDSDFYIECKSAWVHGPTSAILHDAGSLDFTAHDFVRAEDYDVYEGGTAAPRKIIFRASRAYAGDSIVETATAFTNWGDAVFTIGYGEALAGGGSFGNVAVSIADRAIMDIGVLNFKRSSATISGGLTNKAMTGSGILRNCTIYSLPASTFSTIGRYDASYGTEFRLVNCTIYGPTGVDAIEYSTAAGKFSLENTRVISGANATNAIRAGATGSRIEMAGLNTLDKPNHANITVVNSTNYTTSISASGKVIADAFTTANAVTAGDLVAADANITGATTLQDVIVNGEFVLSTGAGSGKVLTSDGAGAGTWQTATGGSNFVVSAHGNLTVTNTLTVGTGSTAASMIGISSFQGDMMAFTRATDSPAATGSTNDLQISRSSAAAGQVLTLHSTASGQHVWTNATPSSGGSLPLTWVDIRDYGAVGDGTTENTYAINRAYTNATTSNLWVMIPPGTFIASNLFVTASTFGFGSNSTLKFKSDATGTFLKADTVNTSLRDFTVHGGDHAFTNWYGGTFAAGNRIGISHLANGPAYVKGLRILGFNLTGLQITGTANTDTKDSLYTQNWINNCAFGISNLVGTAEYTTISANKLWSNTIPIIVQSANMHVHDNMVTYSYRGAVWNPSSSGRGHTDFIRNEFNHINDGNNSITISNVTTGGRFFGNRMMPSGTVKLYNCDNIQISYNKGVGVDMDANSGVNMFDNNTETYGILDYTSPVTLLHWNNRNTAGVLVDDTGNPYYTPGGYGLVTPINLAMRGSIRTTGTNFAGYTWTTNRMQLGTNFAFHADNVPSPPGVSGTNSAVMWSSNNSVWLTWTAGGATTNNVKIAGQ